MLCCLHMALLLVMQPDVHGTAKCAWHSCPGLGQHCLGQSEAVHSMNSCTTAWGCNGDPEQHQELPSMGYPHSSPPPSPPRPSILLLKQWAHSPLHPAFWWLVALWSYGHHAMQGAEPMHRLHGTYGCFGDKFMNRKGTASSHSSHPPENQSMHLAPSLPSSQAQFGI